MYTKYYAKPLHKNYGVLFLHKLCIISLLLQKKNVCTRAQRRITYEWMARLKAPAFSLIVLQNKSYETVGNNIIQKDCLFLRYFFFFLNQWSKNTFSNCKLHQMLKWEKYELSFDIKMSEGLKIRKLIIGPRY